MKLSPDACENPASVSYSSHVTIDAKKVLKKQLKRENRKQDRANLAHFFGIVRGKLLNSLAAHLTGYLLKISQPFQRFFNYYVPKKTCETDSPALTREMWYEMEKNSTECLLVRWKTHSDTETPENCKNDAMQINSRFQKSVGHTAAGKD